MAQTLELNIVKAGEQAAILEISGEIDLFNAKLIKQGLADVCADSRDVLLDFGEVHYIDSAGLGAILSVVSKLRSEGKVLRFFSVGEQVMNLLRMTMVDTLVEIYETKEAAVATLKPD